MSEFMRPRSPLADRTSIAGARIFVAERPFLGKVNVRGDAGQSAFTEGVARICGRDLPLVPNTVAGDPDDDLSVYWLGPNEWQVVTAPGDERRLLLALEEALADGHSAIVNVSDYYTTIRVAGAGARDLLSQGTPLDLHPRSFRPGQCAQTRLAKASVLIVPVDESPAFDLQIRWSMASYLFDWIADATGEYL